jgi:hypothetical protein
MVVALKVSGATAAMMVQAMVASALAAAAQVTFGETAPAAASRGTVAVEDCGAGGAGGFGCGVVMSVLWS